MNSRISRASLRIVLPYVLFGGLWIALSDRALEALADDPALITQWSTYKGWAFVFVTAALLFLLLRAELRARERGQAALRASEAHYRQLFDANPHPMWVYDSETLRFLAVNDVAVAHYGFSRDEFLAMSITDIRPPQDVPRLLQDIAAHRDSPLRDSGLWRHRKRDGATIEVEIRSHALDFAGRPARLVLAHDVTARRQTERARQQSERFAQSVLDSLTANIAIVDEQGRIVAVNRAWRRFAEQNPPVTVPVSEGADYLQVCDRAQGDAACEARAFAAGLRKVMRGQCAEFGLVYPCHSPDEQRWFAARVTRLPGDGPARVVVAHTDITALKRAEAAARQLADRLGHYLSASPCIVYALAAQGGRFVTEWVSENVQAVLGYSVQEAQGDGWWFDGLHPEDRDAAANFAAALGDGDPLTHSYRFRRADGSWIWVQDQMRLQRDAQGAVIRVIGVWTDVTELRRAQQALADSEARYRAMFEQAAVGVARVDLDGRWLEVNQRVCEMTGYSRAELLAMSFRDITDAGDIEASEAQDRRLLAGELASATHETRYRRKDGSTVWVSRSAALVRGAGGEPEYFVAVTADISDRKNAEARLRASTERLQAIFDNEPECVKLTSADGRLLDINPAGLRMVEADSLDAVAGRPAREFVHADDRAAFDALLRRVGGGQRGQLEFRIVGMKGGERWADTHAAPLFDADGRLTSILSVTRDVSEAKRRARIQAVEADILEAVGADLPLAAVLDKVARGAQALIPGARVSIMLVDGDGDGAHLRHGAAPDLPADYVRAIDGIAAREGAGSCGTAVHRRQPVVVGDIDTDPLWRNFRALGRAHGLRACWSTPVLGGDGTPLAAFAVYHCQPWLPGADEKALIAGLTHLVGVAVDRRRRAEALRDSEQRFRQLAENIKEVFWLTDPAKNRMIYISPAYEAIWGRSCASLYAAPADWLEAVHPDDRDRVRQAVSSKQANGTYDEVYRIVRPDGSVRWIHDRAYPVRDAQGEVYRLAGTAEDVTERKRAEDELRRLSLAIEQSSESIVITDVQGRIEFVNDAFVRISGYSREELLGRNPRLLQSGRTPADTYASMWIALARGESWQGEFFNRRKDGGEYVEAATVSPIRQPDGTITHYVASKEDITEKRRIAEELERYRHTLEELVAQRTAQLAEARRQAEAANEAKSAFLANMSHEIRTPMNGVLGMLEVLAQSRLSEQQADLVRTARESGRTLLSIIDDILDFSKIEAGRLQIETQPVSVEDLAEGLCDSLLPLAVRQNVDLRVFVSPEIPEQVLTDPLRLRQILFNLLGNAIKFSGGDRTRPGRVTLRVTVASTAPLRLVFAVIDNGIGMSNETIGRLFTPFTQAEASTTRRHGGSGLGLAICRRLAGLMHGEITVDSTPGEGSTFTLVLPVEAAAGAVPRPRPDLAGVECLVIDTSDLDVDGLSAYLGAAGARVHRVVDAAAGARLAAALPPPVVAIRHTGHAQPTRLAALQAVDGLRQLLITRGRRRRPRVESAQALSLDGTAMRRQALLRAVAVAAGRASPEAVVHGADLADIAGAVAPPSAAEARDRGELILVAEDDEVNRKVIVKQLELLGRVAEVAHDGAAALRMWREGRYALLLTDLHMPEMDGYELAAAIRRHEAEHAAAPGGRRLPIVALTANALRGEDERARAAGMDDFLTKPLQLELLRKALARWLPPAGGAAAPAARPHRRPDPSTPALDVAVLKSLIGDDAATLSEFLSYFLQTARRLGVELAAASAAGDARQAGAIAHKLKSSSRSVGALPFGELCAELEEVGKAGDATAVQDLMAPFDRELQRVAERIEALLAAEERRSGP